MVLVSYIDILDYTENDRKSLIHGEDLFNEDRVRKVVVKHKATDDSYHILALCSFQGSLNSFRNNEVSIKLAKGGTKKLESRCSCMPDNSGKCEHIVATLIHLHRHPLDELIESSEVKLPLRQSRSSSKGVLEELTLEHTVQRQHDQQQRRLRNSKRSTGESPFPTVNFGSKSEELICEDSSLTDPNCIKENDEDDIDWEISSDDDWEPAHTKKFFRKNGTPNKKGTVQDHEGKSSRSSKSSARRNEKDLASKMQLGNDGLFRCLICDVTKETSEELQDHIQVTHQITKHPFSCKKCNRSFRHSKTFKVHESMCDAVDSSKEKTAVRLEGGAMNTDKLSKVAVDIDSNVEGELEDCPPPPSPDGDPVPVPVPPRCLLCEVTTDSRQQLRDHYVVAHDRDSVLVCERCGEYRLPRDHICPSQLEFRCRMCTQPQQRTRTSTRTFKAGRDYWNHLIRSSRLHRHTQHRARCGWPGCSERFQGEVELLEHARLHLPEHVTLMCPVCRLVLRNTDAKLAHMEKHDAVLGVFECVACRAAFSDKAALRAHWDSHREERPHRCEACGWRFGSEASLRAHAVRFHQGGPFSCAKCPQKFDDRTDVRIHFGAVHGKARCPDCSFRCGNQAALSRHRSRAHGSLPKPMKREDEEGEARCEHCGSGPMDARALDGHLQAEHACADCGLVLRLPRELRTHRQRAHKAQEPSGSGSGIVCQDCSKTFKSQRDLEEHRRMHTGEKPFICAECGMTFKRAQNLEYHTKGAHKNERNFLCPECGKRFISNADMKRHLRYSHQGGKKWHLCPECGHKLPSLYNLKLHVQSKHTGERPHRCEICGQGFVASSDLKKHVLYKHRKEHPFGCDHCDKRYQRKRDLQLHQQRHHAAALFRCQECGKNFESYASMMQHSRYHTTEEPYQCAKCGRRFPHKMNLSRHLCTPNIKKNFRCHTCGLNFTTGGSLKSHRRRLHAGDTSLPPEAEEEHPPPPPEQPQPQPLLQEQQHDEQLQLQPQQSPGPVSAASLDPAFGDKMWRGVPMPVPGPTWTVPTATAAPPSPSTEVILAEGAGYHELTAVTAEPHAHLLAPPLVFMKEGPGPGPAPAPSPAPAPPQPTLVSLLIKTEDQPQHAQHAMYPQHPVPVPVPPPLQPLHSAPTLTHTPSQSLPPVPPLKLISMPPQPPPLVQAQPPPPPPPPPASSGQGSLILGAPIQTTADGSFHLVFVPHIPAASCQKQ